MPANQRLWAYHKHGRAPIEQPGKKRQRHPCGGIDSSGLYAAFSVQRELSTKKKVLRFHRPRWSERKRDQADKIGQQPQDNVGKGNHPMIMTQQRMATSTQTPQIEFLRRTGQETIKGSLYLLLANCNTLKDSDQSRLDQLLAQDQPLNTLKEQLQRLWQQPADSTRWQRADKDVPRRYLRTTCQAIKWMIVNEFNSDS